MEAQNLIEGHLQADFRSLKELPAPLNFLVISSSQTPYIYFYLF